MSLKEQLDLLVQQTFDNIEKMKIEYHGEPPTDRIRNRIQKILGAPDLIQGRHLARRAVEGAQIHYLSEWSKGKILGKVSIHSLEIQIKKVESLIKMLKQKGLAGQVVTQETRLAALHETVLNMVNRH